jgi:metal-dependent amidase/aminoacylase/carboxypeptidase family protein
MKFSSATTLSLFLTLLVVAILVNSAWPVTAVTSREDEIARAAENLRAKLIETRRDFHMHPELSNREERTSRVVAERLRALGLDEVKTGVGKYGVVALLKGRQPGGAVAVRADMDALPIQEPLVITLGSIHGGNRFNIIADEVKLEGTMRTLSEEVRAKAIEMMRQTLAGVTSAYGASYEIEFGSNTPVTYSAPALVEATLPIMRKIAGEKNVISPRPQMGAEDFSLYQKVIPGFFYFLGVGNKAIGITAMIHTPEFDVDEESLVVGVKVMTSVLLDYLDREAAKK